MSYWKNKTALITGAGYAVLSDGRCGSIGYGIATAYAKAGANLVITGRNMAKLEKAKEELERLYGIRVLALAADISEGSDNESIAKGVAVVKHFLEMGTAKARLIGIFADVAFHVGGTVAQDKIQSVSLQFAFYEAERAFILCIYRII